jgi:hypothetical protein
MKIFATLLFCMFLLAGCGSNNQGKTSSSAVEEETLNEEKIEINNDTFMIQLSSATYNKEENFMKVEFDTGLPDGTIVNLTQYMPSLDTKYERLFTDLPVLDVEVIVKDHKISHTFTNEDVKESKFVSAKYYYGIKVPTSFEINPFIYEKYSDDIEFEKQFPEFKDSVLWDDELVGYEILYSDFSPMIDNAYSIDEIMNEYKAEVIPYKELEKNPDGHYGTPVMFKGRILEIQETDVDFEENGYSKETIIRLNVSDDPNEVIYVVYNSVFGTDFVRDDNITVYGNITGSITYESVAGYQITIPSMEAVVIE